MSSKKWHFSFEADTVTGGTERWTLEGTDTSVTHWRGFFLIHKGCRCLGGITEVTGLSNREYFEQADIPYQNTLAAHYLSSVRV